MSFILSVYTVYSSMSFCELYQNNLCVFYVAADCREEITKIVINNLLKFLNYWFECNNRLFVRPFQDEFDFHGLNEPMHRLPRFF